MAEAEFRDMATMRAYPMPDFCDAEVTDDLRYTGGMLVAQGLPSNV
jgi:CYTH domain-containing protein